MKGLAIRTGEPTLDEVDRILAQHEADFLKEEARNANARNKITSSSPGNSIPPISDPWDFQADSANGVPTSHSKLKAKYDDWSASDFPLAWMPRSQKFINEHQNLVQSTNSSNPRARTTEHHHTRNRKLERNSDPDLKNERADFWNENGFNEYQLTPTDCTKELSEPPSPKTR